MRMVDLAQYSCDWCGAKQDGWVHELPKGWIAEHGELTTHHYCPACVPEFMNDEPEETP